MRLESTGSSSGEKAWRACAAIASSRTRVYVYRHTYITPPRNGKVRYQGALVNIRLGSAQIGTNRLGSTRNESARFNSARHSSARSFLSLSFFLSRAPLLFLLLLPSPSLFPPSMHAPSLSLSLFHFFLLHQHSPLISPTGLFSQLHTNPKFRGHNSHKVLFYLSSLIYFPTPLSFTLSLSYSLTRSIIS